MTFPVIETNAVTLDSYASSMPVTMPSGIVAGNLLISSIASSAGATTQSGGSDWTIIDSEFNSQIDLVIFAKIAAGSDTLTVTDGAGDGPAVAVTLRISGHDVSNVSTDITLGTAATGNSSAPDPPNSNPGSAADYLWLETFGSESYDTSNYESTSYTQVNQGSLDAPVCAVASRNLNASSENPGVMATDTSGYWVAQTLAIPPVAAANTGPGLRVMGGT